MKETAAHPSTLWSAVPQREETGEKAKWGGGGRWRAEDRAALKPHGNAASTAHTGATSTGPPILFLLQINRQNKTIRRDQSTY